eukprot:6210856-Pleurochrysis_carterae.AAC.4
MRQRQDAGCLGETTRPEAQERKDTFLFGEKTLQGTLYAMRKIGKTRDNLLRILHILEYGPTQRE